MVYIAVHNINQVIFSLSMEGGDGRGEEEGGKVKA